MGVPGVWAPVWTSQPISRVRSGDVARRVLLDWSRARTPDLRGRDAPSQHRRARAHRARLGRDLPQARPFVCRAPTHARMGSAVVFVAAPGPTPKDHQEGAGLSRPLPPRGQPSKTERPRPGDLRVVDGGLPQFAWLTPV